MSATDKWSVITVTFNSVQDLKDCWSAAITDAVEWIVVDNASSDGTAEIARQLGATVVELPKNIGFSRANNLGLTMATGDYIAFVNPDVRVEPLSFPLLAESIEKFNAIVAPQLLNADGSKQPNGRGLPFLIDKIANRGIRLPGSRIDAYIPEIAGSPTAVDWLTGAVVCGRKADLVQLGGWDERFFLYYEDQELSLAAWDHGLKVVLDPRVEWIHGWRRATKSLSLKPWFREIASSLRFYRRRPIFLTLARKSAQKSSGSRGVQLS